MTSSRPFSCVSTLLQITCTGGPKWNTGILKVTWRFTLILFYYFCLIFFLHIQYVQIKTSHLTNHFHFGHNTLMMFLMYCNNVKENFGKSSVKKKNFYFTLSVLPVILVWVNCFFPLFLIFFAFFTFPICSLL